MLKDKKSRRLLFPVFFGDLPNLFLNITYEAVPRLLSGNGNCYSLPNNNEDLYKDISRMASPTLGESRGPSDIIEGKSCE